MKVDRVRRRKVQEMANLGIGHTAVEGDPGII